MNQVYTFEEQTNKLKSTEPSAPATNSSYEVWEQ